MKLFRLSRKNKEWKPFLINVHEDFCGYMDGTKKPPVIGMMLPTMFKYSNLNQKCPLSVSYLEIVYIHKIN